MSQAVDPMTTVDRIIAHLKDRKDLILRFLVLFSRVEYALKKAGCTTCQDGRAEPNWGKLENAVNRTFDKIECEKFQEAVQYLKRCPPKKQVVNQGSIEWQEVKIETDAEVIQAIKRVRNNLFHGAKDFDGNRDEQLICAATVILSRCVASVPSDLAEIRQHFEYDG